MVMLLMIFINLIMILITGGLWIIVLIVWALLTVIMKSGKTNNK